MPATEPALTTPVPEPTVTRVLAVLQEPPVLVVVNVTVDNAHKLDEPDMAAGNGLTVTVA